MEEHLESQGMLLRNATGFVAWSSLKSSVFVSPNNTSARDVGSERNRSRFVIFEPLRKIPGHAQHKCSISINCLAVTSILVRGSAGDQFYQ